MPIAIRAKQGSDQASRVNCWSAPQPLRGRRTGKSCQALSEPRRGSAAHHQRDCVGRRLGRFRGDMGAGRSGRAHAGGMLDRRELQDHPCARPSRSAAGAATSPRSYCWMVCRPGRIFSTGCGLKISPTPGFRVKRRSGISVPRRPSGSRYRLSGRAIRPGRAGVSIPVAAACEPTPPCSKIARTSSFIAAITSMPTVRSRRS